MTQAHQHLEEAARYLESNEGLRAAVGASDDDALEPHCLGVGEHNLNYWFNVPANGRKFVLRINVVPQPFHNDQVAYEFGALQALQSSGRTPDPVFLDNGESAPGKGALVIGFREGEELDFDHLRLGDLRCAAQIMADVHAVEVTPECTVFRPKDPLKRLFEECLQRFASYRASGFEEERITRWVESFIAAAEPMTRTSCLPSDCMHIVNTETLPSHFLIPAASAAKAADAVGTGRFCENPGSFVDWERPVIGEVAQDVAFFVSPTTTFWDCEFLFPADEACAFAEDYWRAVDGRFERGNFNERFWAFRMMTALRSATWFCKQLPAYKLGTSHMTEKTRAKFPAYLSDDFMDLLARDCFGL
jgi:hypothetical protein